MFLYLVGPESSRISRRKVYKRIGVVFRWFSQECLERISCRSVVFTEVSRRSREKLGGFVKYRQRSCLLNCNREVTCVWQRPCLYKSYGSPGVVTSLA